MSIDIIETELPREALGNIIGIPTRNRWILQPGRQPGRHNIILKHTIESAARILDFEGLSPETWIMVSDASSPDSPDMSGPRRKTLAQLDLPAGHAPIYLATRQTRFPVMERLMEITGFEQEVVKAAVDGVGYGDNRETLDNLVAASSLAGGEPIRFVSVDDDVILPHRPLRWRKDVLTRHGIEPLPNSQVVYAFTDPERRADFLEEIGPNSLRAFVAPLGRTVNYLRREEPGLIVSEQVIDTRPKAFELAMQGQMAQFILVPDKRSVLLDSDQGVTIASTVDKSGLPDYPTWKISRETLIHEFPPEELVEAYPSGPRQRYAALGSDTIFPDSALLGRIFNASADLDSAYWPWWHVSSLNASKRAGIVTSSFRADNDFLPKWLAHIYKKTGTLYLYVSGLPTYALHSRTPFGGDRRDPHEAAIASQVGNIAAVATFKRFEFPPTGTIYMHPIENSYQVPDDHARIVFERMKELASISREKIGVLNNRLDETSDPLEKRRLRNLLDRYTTTHNSLEEKMSDFDYEEWKGRLDKTTKQQLEFSRAVLAAKPVIIEELGQMITRGEYPVLQVVRR